MGRGHECINKQEETNKAEYNIQNVCSSNHFSFACNDKNTFFHNNGACSQIDLIIVKGDSVLRNYHIHDKEPQNTSTHVTVSTDFQASEIISQSSPSKDNTNVNKRTRWYQIDIEKYTEIIDKRIAVFETMGRHLLPTEVAIQRLNSIIVESAHEALGKQETQKKKKNIKLCPPDVVSASKLSKITF